MARYNRASPPMVMSFEVKGALSLISIRHDIPPERRIAGQRRRGGSTTIAAGVHPAAAASGSFAMYSSTRAESTFVPLFPAWSPSN